MRPFDSACFVPTIRTGTSGAPVASASLAAPRVHAPPCTVPCGKIATLSPARSSSSARPTESRSRRSRRIGIPPSASISQAPGG